MPQGNLFGIADTHVHFVNHLGSGGYLIWGKPHPANPATVGEAAEAECLGHCDGPHGHGPSGWFPSLEGTFPGHLVGGFPEFDGWPKFSTLAHQQAFIEWIYRAYQGGLRLAVCHAGNSALVATRMTELYGPNFGDASIDDMSAIRRQVAGMRAMRDFVDAQSGGPGRGWLQIALTADEARAVVAADKLCIVMGVEVAALGNWSSPEDLEAAAAQAGKTPAALIDLLLDELFSLGIRHVFPIHGTNNAFGGTALFIRNYDAANYLFSKKSFTVEKADPALGISYRIDEDQFTGGTVAEVLGYYGIASMTTYLSGLGIGIGAGAIVGGIYGATLGGVLGGVAASVKLPCPPKPTNWSTSNVNPALDTTTGGHINALGLTQYGKLFVEGLISRGILIDIDHMGEKTTSAVLEICENHHYPVVSGHASFRELRHTVPGKTFRRDGPDVQLFGTRNVRNLTREVDKSVSQLTRIKNLGGYISPILAQSEGLPCSCGQWALPNDAAGSSKSFGQALLYAYEKMGGSNVGIGSDIDGAGTLPGPRFGPLAASGLRETDDRFVLEQRGVTRRTQVLAQAGGVKYSTMPLEYRFSRFCDDAPNIPGAPFDTEERDFWQAIVMDQSGMKVEFADWTGQGVTPFDGGRQSRISNFAAGLRARGPNGLFFGFVPSPTVGVVGSMDMQYSAYCIANGQSPVFPLNTPGCSRLFPKLQAIWSHWNSMMSGGQQRPNDWIIDKVRPQGSTLYDGAGKLRRSFAGSGNRRRDFDINVDGMAHFGMLPDFMEELWSAGVPREPLEALYRSADAFISVWDNCENTSSIYAYKSSAANCLLLF